MIRWLMARIVRVKLKQFSNRRRAECIVSPSISFIEKILFRVGYSNAESFVGVGSDDTWHGREFFLSYELAWIACEVCAIYQRVPDKRRTGIV